MKFAAIAFVVLAAGCGGSEPSEVNSQGDAVAIDTFTPLEDTNAPREDSVAVVDTGSAGDAPTDADLFGAYPAGPYGNKIGDVVANLAWEGYVSPLADALANTKPYVTTSMDKLRRDARKGYALVHVSEFY